MLSVSSLPAWSGCDSEIFFVCQTKSVLGSFKKWHSCHSHPPMALKVRLGLGEMGLSLC